VAGAEAGVVAVCSSENEAFGKDIGWKRRVGQRIF
jgi:hypothetical protein